MKLLKPEVKRLALSVIQDGDITAESVPQLPGANVTKYINPEVTRDVQHNNSTDSVKLKARNQRSEAGCTRVWAQHQVNLLDR